MACRRIAWSKSAPASRSSTPSNKSLRGSRGPEAGVRGLPSPFINLDERGRETPHPSLLPLAPMRKDFLDEILGGVCCRKVIVLRSLTRLDFRVDVDSGRRAAGHEPSPSCRRPHARAGGSDRRTSPPC